MMVEMNQKYVQLRAEQTARLLPYDVKASMGPIELLPRPWLV